VNLNAVCWDTVLCVQMCHIDQFCPLHTQKGNWEVPNGRRPSLFRRFAVEVLVVGLRVEPSRDPQFGCLSETP
jgi:hypothetical protein